MFAFIARFFHMLTNLVNVIETNINTLEEISAVGNDMAKNFRAEQTLINQQRLAAIQRGEDPDQE